MQCIKGFLLLHKTKGYSDMISHQFQLDYLMMNGWLFGSSLMNNENYIIQI